MLVQSSFVLLSMLMSTATVFADQTKLSACDRLKRQTYVFNVDEENIDLFVARSGVNGGEWTLVLPTKSERVVLRRVFSEIFYTVRDRTEIDGDRMEIREQSNFSEYDSFSNCITSPENCMSSIAVLEKLIHAARISAPADSDLIWAAECAKERTNRMANRIRPLLPTQSEESRSRRKRRNPFRPGGSGNPFDPGNHSNPFSPKL